jgi:hypothetical protein
LRHFFDEIGGDYSPNSEISARDNRKTALGAFKNAENRRFNWENHPMMRAEMGNLKGNEGKNGENSAEIDENWPENGENSAKNGENRAKNGENGYKNTKNGSKSAENGQNGSNSAENASKSPQIEINEISANQGSQISRKIGVHGLIPLFAGGWFVCDAFSTMKMGGFDRKSVFFTIRMGVFTMKMGVMRKCGNLIRNGAFLYEK